MLLWKYGDRDTVERADLTGLPPQELAMIGKTLLNLDEIGHVLAPHFEPNTAIQAARR